MNGFHCRDNVQLNISQGLLQRNMPTATFPTKCFLSNARTKKSLLFEIEVAKGKKVFFPHLEVWEPRTTPKTYLILTPFRNILSPILMKMSKLHQNWALGASSVPIERGYVPLIPYSIYHIIYNSNHLRAFNSLIHFIIQYGMGSTK